MITSATIRLALQCFIFTTGTLIMFRMTAACSRTATETGQANPPKGNVLVQRKYQMTNDEDRQDRKTLLLLPFRSDRDESHQRLTVIR